MNPTGITPASKLFTVTVEATSLEHFTCVVCGELTGKNSHQIMVRWLGERSGFICEQCFAGGPERLRRLALERARFLQALSGALYVLATIDGAMIDAAPLIAKLNAARDQVGQ
jgi:hypothetical protein